MINKFIDLFFSVYFNLKYLKLKDGIKLPIKISHKIKIYHLKRGNIIIDSTKKAKFMISIGFDGSNFVSKNQSSINIINNGKLIFCNNVKIGEGVNIFIDGGTVSLGNNIFINRNMLLECLHKITISDNCLIGWNLSLRDTPGHQIRKNGCEHKREASVLIENGVWVASDVTIVGSCLIREGCIVGCNSVIINFKSNNKNRLIAGLPAEEKDGEYSWIN